MKTNMGLTDKIVRVLIALAIIVLYFAKQISGMPSVILLIFSAVFIITSFFGFCPLYLPFNISTKKRKK